MHAWTPLPKWLLPPDSGTRRSTALGPLASLFLAKETVLIYFAMSELRRFPRVTWLVEAQVFFRDENLHWDVRLTDISEGGCFVDTLVPLGPGSSVLLKVNDETGELQVPGKILYGQQTIGSAIAFDPLDPYVRLRILKILAARSG